jgi:tetratricopeptide (TPR) repeat protein
MPGTGVAGTRPQVRIGRVSITLEPSFFFVTGAIGLVSGTFEGLVAWLVAVLVSVLVHELGHAAVFVAMGSDAKIRLYSLGGLTSGRVSGSRWRSIAVSLAGPVAGILLLGVPVWLIQDATTTSQSFIELLLTYTVWASLGWSLLNLLPLQHLDGGNIARSLLEFAIGDRAQVVAPMVSLVTAGACAVVALSLRQPFLALYALIFVPLSLTALRDARNGPAREEVDQIHRAIDDGRLPEATARADRLASARLGGAVVRDVAELPAWIALRRGDHAATDAALAALPPGSTPSAYLRAAIAAAAGRRDEATGLASEAYETEPRWPPNRQLARGLADAGAVPGLVTALAGADFHDRIAAIDRLQLDLHREGRYADALIAGRRAMELEPSGRLAYNVACAAARAGDREGAIDALDRAVTLGWDDRTHATADDDLADLRSHARWGEIVARMGPP